MQNLVDAWQRLQQGDRAGAMQLTEALLRTQPASVQAWLLLAEISTAPAQQRQALERAIALDPTNQHARQALARLAQRIVALPDWLDEPLVDPNMARFAPPADPSSFAPPAGSHQSAASSSFAPSEFSRLAAPGPPSTMAESPSSATLPLSSWAALPDEAVQATRSLSALAPAAGLPSASSSLPIMPGAAPAQAPVAVAPRRQASSPWTLGTLVTILVLFATGMLVFKLAQQPSARAPGMRITSYFNALYSIYDDPAIFNDRQRQLALDQIAQQYVVPEDREKSVVNTYAYMATEVVTDKKWREFQDEISSIEVIIDWQELSNDSTTAIVRINTFDVVLHSIYGDQVTIPDNDWPGEYVLQKINNVWYIDLEEF